MQSRYLDPKNDLAFKKIFGDHNHKSIPIHFLNAVLDLEGEDEIIDLKFVDPKQPPKIAARKESTVDVLVEDEKGTKYIVEMQVAKIKGFEKRAQYYAAKTYCGHFNSGDPYHDLKKVVFLAIADYEVFPNKTDYKSSHVTLDKKTLENDLKDFSFTFVELPKFTKTLEELETIEDKWYYFLKHVTDSNEIIGQLGSDPDIKEAYEVLDRYHWTEEELTRYEKVWMRVRDDVGKLEAAKEEGIKKGLKEGIQKGLEEGIQKGKQEGLEEGLKKGEREKAVSFAQWMISEGIPLEKIREATGLDQKTIEDFMKQSGRV